MSGWKVLRVIADRQGQSRFEEALVDFAEIRPGLAIGPFEAATGVGFRRFAPGFASDFHPTGLREVGVLLSGAAEYEVSSGERRQLGPGDVIQLEDTHGIGHRSRNVGDEERVMLVVALPT